MNEQGESGVAAATREIDDACRELFTLNMATLTRWAPSVAKQLALIKTPLSTLVPVGDDDWDIEFGGISLYNMGAKVLSAGQVDDFLAHPTQITLSSPKSSGFDKFGTTFNNGLQAAFDQQSIEVGTDFAGDTAYHLISLGVGLGFHLPILMDRIKCGNLILLEANIEFIYHSLFVFDWSQIFDPVNRPNLSISFLTAVDEIKTPIIIREIMRTNNPSLIEGSKTILHYPSDEYQRVFRNVMKDITLAFSGLGFMTDEVRMVRNSYLTLKPNRSLMFLNLKKDSDWPVIIVGSGPSLDDTIDHLKRVADRAIIIVCGTALPALLQHGVRPDIFVILENGPDIYDYVKKAAETWELGGITLIGTTTIDPRLMELFDRSVLFMRPALASFPMFCRDDRTALSWGYPTVTNTGLGIAIGLGYKNIYLFGVDLGSREPLRHHSALSPYHAENGIEYEGVLDKPVPGNLGGVIYTEYVLNWARDTFEQAINNARLVHRVFNCSDGAFIRGTTPKLPRTLELPEPRQSKAEELDSVWSELSPYGEDNFQASWSLDRLVAEQNKLRADLLEILQDASTVRDAFTRMVRIMLAPNARPAQHFIRGTVLQYMIISNHYDLRASDDQREAVTKIILDALSLGIDDLTDQVLVFLTDLDAGIDRGPWLMDEKGEPSEW